MSWLTDSELMRRIDEYTINEAGIASEVLMERAALAVARRIAGNNDGKAGRVLVVYGRGNNGGDGLAAGRILKLWGWDVSAVPASSDIAEDSMSVEEQKQYRSARFCGVDMLESGDLEKALKAPGLVLIDAIFGIGLKRAVEGRYLETIEMINRSSARVCAVDIPSGISADNGEVMGFAVKADMTVTFGFAKRGHFLYPGAVYAGKLYVEDAGFAVNDAGLAQFAQKTGAAEGSRGRAVSCFLDEREVHLPERFAWSNKGSYGKVLIVGAAQGCAGAGYLAAHAAFMAGCGMVKVLTCRDTVNLLNARQPEAMTGVLFGDDGEYDAKLLDEGIKWADVVLVGPGLGRSEAAHEVLEKILASGKRLTVDADALNIIAEQGLTDMIQGPSVLTPHIGELARLTGKDPAYLKAHIFDTAVEYTYNNKLTYVCKDARTVVASGGNLHMNVNGNSGMSTAGAGDVLAGLTAGLMAAGLDTFEAARTGVFIHAAAGDAAAAKSCEDCITAGMIADELPGCIRNLRNIK